MEIPYRELSAPVLTAVIEEFVLREGTEYGAQDYSLQSKVAQVKRQLERGEVRISFDPDSGSCQIFAAQEGRQDDGNESPGEDPDAGVAGKL